jgi:pimeloyl-ACP methyl ester carboxylesterase
MTEVPHNDGLSAAEAAGIRLLVRDGAPERTVVLLHGIGGRASSFVDVMRRWPAGPRVIAWDAPGYGSSPPVASAWPRAEDYAAALARVCDALACEAIDLAGQSLGALIAGAFAVRHPARLRRLVLISPAQGYSVEPDAALPQTLADRSRAFTTAGPERFAAARARHLVHDAARKPGVVAAVRDAMATLTEPGHTQAVRMLASGNLAARAAEIRHATLLVSGAEDLITPLSGTRALFARLQSRPRASGMTVQLHVIENAGHAVYLEAPDELARIMSSFLAGAT